MMKTILFLLLFSTLIPAYAQQSPLPFRLEELSSPEFRLAVERSGGVCVLPMGIIEKHGPHLPLGTDLYEAREVAFTAASMEYAVVFPPYYTGQIFEAMHQPGTIAYSSDLMWQMLEETCLELSRNGLKKIILLNGHGGNTSFLQFFCQAQLAKQRDFVVVFFRPQTSSEFSEQIGELKKARVDGHAGEEETSMMYYIDKNLVDLDAMANESGLDEEKLAELPYGYTGIWWYASFPNHFASDICTPNEKLGELLIRSDAVQLASLVKYMKENDSIKLLQDEFYSRSVDPLK